MQQRALRRTPGRFLQFGFLSLILLTTVLQIQAATPPPPRILATRVSGNTLVVTVSVPRGWSSVVLESRPPRETGAWIPRAVAHSGLQSGRVVLRVPASLRSETLQVRGELQQPLPASFYRGRKSFGGHSSGFWRLDAGRGEVLMLAADGQAPPGLVTGVEPSPRPVVESDIWVRRDNTLYFFNQMRGLMILDITQADAPFQRGLLPMPAVGEEMYLCGSSHVALLARDDCGSEPGSKLVIVDVTEAKPAVVATVSLGGNLQETRMVGSVLYAACQTFRETPGGATGDYEWGTRVVSVNLRNPASPTLVSQLWFAGQGYAVAATDRLFLLAAQYAAETGGSLVHLVNIADPTGVMRQASNVVVAGRVADKFKMHLAGDVLSVFSERFDADPTGSLPGDWGTVLETFSLTDPAAPTPAGRLELGRGEHLFATRFDGDRAYVVTFRQTDPLWVVDISNPAQPFVAGHVEVPGWSTFIQPMGNQLLTLGVETNRVAVSLFDVTDTAHPALISRVPLGENYSWSEANWNEKALTVLSESGLVLVPYEGLTSNGFTARLQLLDLTPTSLIPRGIISHRVAPRRSMSAQGRVLSISSREFLSVDIADREHPTVKASVELAWPVNRLFVQGGYVAQLSDSDTFGQGSAFLRIATTSDPNTVLNRLDLGPGPVAGATFSDGRLYLLRVPTSGFLGPVLVPLASGVDTVTSNAVLTVVDLRAMPTCAVVGQTEIEGVGLQGLTYDAVWPSPGVLVWVGSGSSWGWVPMFSPALEGLLSPGLVDSATLPVLGGVSLLRPWWGGDSGAHLLAFDTTASPAPRFLSRVDLVQQDAWGYSKPLASQGRVYLSHQQTTFTSTGTGPKPATGGIWMGDQPQARDYLDVVDYFDPAFPAVRQPVNIPGQIVGLSHQGNMLYLLGNRLTPAGVVMMDGEAVHVCAYDGVNAYLVDSLNLGVDWPRPVVVDQGAVYLGVPPRTNAAGSSLETWGLSAQGRFERRGFRSTPNPILALARLGDVLAASDVENRVLVFDPAAPNGPALRAETQAGRCLWLDLNRASGSLTSGLWLPLDDYGLQAIALEAGSGQ